MQEDEENYVFDDEEVHPKNHDVLLQAVSQLYRKKKIEAPTRSEPATKVSEFHLSSGQQTDDVIKVHDLIRVLDKKATHKEIGKNVRLVQKKSKTLKKPLEKIYADRIARKLGYESVRKQLSKWDAIVHRNRSANQLVFPLKDQHVDIVKEDDYKTPFKEPTELEQEMQKILGTSEVAKEELEKEKEMMDLNLSLEEMIKRRQMIAKMRARESYRIAKAVRQNKIKSKKYHRILKREKMKKELKEFELLQKTNPEAALEKLERIERARAEERMSLRHRNTGKWARSRAIRAKYDTEARAQLAEQLAKSRDLTKKLNQDTDSDNEEDDTGPADNISSAEKNNPWVKKSASEINDFISGYRKYWDEVEKEKQEKTNNVSVQRNRSLEADEVESNTSNVMVSENNSKNEETDLEIPPQNENQGDKSKSESELIRGPENFKGDVEEWSDVENNVEVRQSEDKLENNLNSANHAADNSYVNNEKDNSKDNLENLNEEDKHLDENSEVTSCGDKLNKELEQSLTINKNVGKLENHEDKHEEKNKKQTEDVNKNDTELLGSEDDHMIDNKRKEMKLSGRLKQKTSPKRLNKKQNKQFDNGKVNKSENELKYEIKSFDVENNPKPLSVNVQQERNQNFIKKDMNVENKSECETVEKIASTDICVEQEYSTFIDSGIDKKTLRKTNKSKKVKNVLNSSGSWSVLQAEKVMKKSVKAPEQRAKAVKRPSSWSIEEIFQGVEDKVKNNALKKFKDIQDDMKLDIVKEVKISMKKRDKSSDLSMKKKPKVSIDEKLLEVCEEGVSTGENDIRGLLDRISSNEKDTTQNLPEIDPDKFLPVKQKKLMTHAPELEEEGDDASGDEDEKQKHLNLIEAFGDDDVVDQFRKEKEDEINADKPKDVDLTLPGWGHWAGCSMPPVKKRKTSRRFVVKFPEVKRKDATRQHVIINENVDVRLKDHMVNELPYPFKSVKEYEASIRAPIGNNWIPEVAHKRLTAPPVLTKMGSIIEPMDPEQLVKNIQNETKISIKT
ncbi:U3 small nucleolar RNA-associated protein 14 homolog A [Cimex lectularius]|uniref:U3 small nucleolar RNA-associated protein 14 homolog A n=1 Tax=Cimex lectularius TaxID=79782 RepID=A0A8I6REC7_CIMLE|nr:U3 small nucleolar RNA-associated protein 14 homolog A [Cimex lectularius]